MADQLETAVSCDWVTKLFECSPEKAFSALSEIVAADVESVNSLGRHGVKFKINNSERRVIVVRERDLGGFIETWVVEIKVSGEGIQAFSRGVTDFAGTPILVAVPRLNDNGECIFEVEGKERQAWQVTRQALQDLFFNF